MLHCPADDLVWRGPSGALKSYSGNSGIYYDGPIAYGERIPLSSVPQPQQTLMYCEHWGGWCGMNWGRFLPLAQRSWGYEWYDIRQEAVRQQLVEWFDVHIPVGFVTFMDYYWGGVTPDFTVPIGYPHHLGGMNVSFCDGRALNMKYEDALYPTNNFSLNPVLRNSGAF